MQDSLQWWQWGINLVWLVLFALALARLLRRRGKGSPWVNVGMLALAVAGHFATRRWTEPASHPLPSSRAERVHLVTENSFDSNEEPAVAIEAPTGWRVELRESDKTLMLDDGANLKLLVQSAYLKEDVDLPRLLELVRSAFSSNGFTATDSTFDDAIDGLPALGMLSRSGNETICTWLVKRDTRYVSTVQCAASGAPDARSGCKSVLERIRWRTPR